VKYHDDPTIKDALRNLGLSEKQINGPNMAYMGCFFEFFTACLEELKIRLPSLPDTISFIFENKKDDGWHFEAHRTFNFFQKTEPGFSAIDFGNPLVPEFIPLQAADMFAYRLRERQSNEFKSGKLEPLTPLDYALWGNFKPDELTEHLQNLFGK
jgi:hypothetical protein